MCNFEASSETIRAEILRIQTSGAIGQDASRLGYIDEVRR
jgi:hypothetical protein